MKVLKKAGKIIGWAVLTLIIVILGFSVYIWKVSVVPPPKVSDTSALTLQRRVLDDSASVIGSNWIRKNEYGLYEMSVSGKPFERGVIAGKLSKLLLAEQEKAFTDQIRIMIPSSGYLKFLKYIIGFMNKDLPDYVLPEYKKEIYGISLSAEDSFRWIGSNYDRILNYHAAHDIGHALQNLMLVGCTSFGAWGIKGDGGAMIIGRNFDFWVGDEFAKNKIVEFVRPSSGHNFAFVTWGGFIGVVSGMNDQGLTVTINAAKSSIPWGGAATPVSLVAREILQYARDIKEAVAIAHQRKMFVSESFLIGSAKDHKAVIIEKTPDTLAVYDPGNDHIVCTNHYQSRLFQTQKLNEEQMANSASVYRYKRVQQLMRESYPLTPSKAAAILRDHRGLNNTSIGLGNEKAVNQFIAHHSVIFMPDSLRMWVSSNPWQMGEYVCYDLKKIFAMKSLSADRPVADTALNIPPDPLLRSPVFQKYLDYRRERSVVEAAQSIVDIAAFIRDNPDYYGAYEAAGDYWLKRNQPERAATCYQKALTLVIDTNWEREKIEKKLKTAEQNAGKRPHKNGVP
ncbi:MAG TPA: C45 family peptidase [Edaphocola sp.]|nr:C45 family peptidase [Edaphocola sp.]